MGHASAQRAPAGATIEDIEALYRARFADFLRVATAILSDREAARDAVQEGFARALRDRGSFRGGPGSLDGWLWRAVVNAARNQRRGRVADPLDAASSPTSDPVPPEDEHAGLRDALARLPERQRIVLFLRYYADLDYRAIAGVLDIRPGTVGAALHAGHAALRRTLEEER